MSRRLIVAGNWKMNLGLSESVDLALRVKEAAQSNLVDVAIFPTIPWLVPVSGALQDSGVLLGAQNCYTVDSGAFTGEVSPTALSEVCTVVLAGHSERRHILGETNSMVGDKVAAILSAGLTAYLCVGEKLEERDAGVANETVHTQLATGLAQVEPAHLARIVVAYEPVWAIGTGVAATADDAQSMCQNIRDWLGTRFGEAGRGVRVLYGGSVSPSNADDLFQRADIDGGLIGGASLNAESFGALIQAAVRAAAV